MSAESMSAGHEIVYDREKNRIYITAVGDWDIAQSEAFLRDYREAVAQTRPGFSVVSDVRGFKCSTEDVQQKHAEAIKLDAEAGVKKVARVVGSTPLAGFQIKRISRDVENCTSENFETLEEAESHLDSDRSDDRQSTPARALSGRRLNLLTRHGYPGTIRTFPPTKRSREMGHLGKISCYLDCLAKREPQ